MNYIAIGLTIAGVIAFFNAGEWEARDGSANHAVLWAMLSLLASVLVLFVAGLDWLPWLFAQVGLFVGIAAVRVLIEDHNRK